MRLKKQDFLQPSKVGYSKENIWVFRKKTLILFKSPKLKILLLDATEIVRLLKTLKNCFLLEKKIGFSKKNLGFFRKPLKALFNLMRNAIELVRSLKTFKNFVFFLKKQRLVFRKILAFPKIAKSSKVALQGHWKRKNSQSVPKIGVLLKKMDGFFRKEISYFSKNW